MEKSISKILMGGIYTHLVHMLAGKKPKVWSYEQFGGKINAQRLHPYVIVTNTDSRIWRSVTFYGAHHRVTLDLMTPEGCSLDDAVSQSDDIIQALHGADFILQGHALIEIQHEKADYNIIADKNAYLVRLLFTILTVVD